MRPSITITALSALTISLASAAQDPVLDAIPKVFGRAATSYTEFEKVTGDSGKFPRTIEKDGSLKCVGPTDWTSGFYPGSLWMLYEYTGEPKWKAAALKSTNALESLRHFRDHHDVGFMLGCSYGNALRLAPDETDKSVLLDGAVALSTRYNDKLGLIRSWDTKPYEYPVIIDNMMNLELLNWARKNGGDAKLGEIALHHADKTAANHFRPDGSAYHVLDYRPENGAIRAIYACQGGDVRTAWARGQAWAMYGFSMMFRDTGKPEYLEKAVAVADFVRNHPNLPEDKVPFWDFGATASPDTPRDASSAAIMASALIEISQSLGKEKGAPYLELARQQLLSLSKPPYLAEPGTNADFLIAHCTGALPLGGEIDVPLNYADYYFLEALLRYRALATDGKRVSFGQLH